MAKMNFKKGQVLPSLLFLTMVCLMIVVVALDVSVMNFRSSRETITSLQVYSHSEGALDNALERTLRDINYTGESLQLGGSLCIIEVAGNWPEKVVTATCKQDDKIKKVRSTVKLVNGLFSVVDYKEII